MPTNWSGITIAQLSERDQLPFLQYVLSHPNETQLLRGVAGSGKTLVAAFALAELQDNQNVGLLVFTNMLEQYIKQNYDDKSKSLVVDHFHSWKNNIPLVNRDIFIVDEAQDFKQNWIDKIKINSNSQIWIADFQQQIYSRAMKKSDLIAEVNSLRESQKQFIFSENYRNTLPIAKFASNFITVTSDENNNGITREKKINDFIIPMIKVNRPRNESPVTFIKAENIDQEYNAIVKLVQELQNREGIASCRIAIVHMLQTTVDRITEDISVDRISRELSQREIPHYRKEPQFNHDQLPDFTNDKLIVVSPISSLKGLEFDYIFFPHSEYATLFNDPYIRDNLLFVLFTRAKKGVYCSYVDEQASYVWDRIKDQMVLDYIEKIHAEDILNPPLNNNNLNPPNDINI